MFLYALRVDLATVTVAMLCAWLAKRGSYFAVRETNDKEENPHCHAVLVCEEGKIKTLRTAFTRAFPDLKGNGSYSLTVVKDEDKYDRYMCKGAAEGELPDVVGRQGVKYTDSWIEEMNRQYWSLNFKSMKNKYQKDGKKLSFLDFVVQECKKRRIDWNCDSDIARVYIELAATEKKVLCQATLKKHVEGAKLQLCGDQQAVEYFVQKYYGCPIW